MISPNKEFGQKEIIKNRKIGILLLLANVAILLFSYGFFLHVHYSGDTYIVYSLDDSLVNIRNGRPLGFLLAKVAYSLGLQNASVQPLVTFFAFVLISGCVAALAFHIAQSFKLTSIWPNIGGALVFVDLALLIIFVNGYFLDWMRFPERYIMIYGPAWSLGMIGLYLTVSLLTAGDGFSKSKSTIYWLAICFSLLLSSWCYQVILFFYLQITVALSLAVSTHCYKCAVRSVLTGVLVVLLVSLCSSFGAKGIYNLFIARDLIDPSLPVRSTVASLGAILDNLVFLVNNLWPILLNGQNTAVRYMPLFGIASSAICAAHVLVKARKGQPLKFVVDLAALVGIFLLAFSVQLLSASHDLSARTLVGFYVAISSYFLVFACVDGTEDNKRRIGFGYGVAVLILICGIGACRIGTSVELEINSQERMYADQVQASIEEHEKATGESVRTICRTADSNPSPRREELETSLFNDERWNIATYWTTTYMINQYEGTDYLNEEMSDTDKARLFGDVNYDSFEPDKQIVFEGDKLYLLVY